MRARIAITDDEGRVYEGGVNLVMRSAPSEGSELGRQAEEPLELKAPQSSKIDFGLPIRAFMSRHARGLSGHAAFAVLAARLTGGKVGQEVHLGLMESEWNKIKGILPGSYAAVYGTRAKNNAWVDSPKRGVIVLLQDWAQALAK